MKIIDNESSSETAADGVAPTSVSVVHVITRMIIGGAQENTLSSVVGLADLPGFDVRLVTGPETGPEGDLLAATMPRITVEYVPALRRSIHPLRDLRAAWSLYTLFRRTRPNVVHTHSSKAGVLGRIAAKAARVPVVVHTLHGLPFHDYQPRALAFAYRSIKRTMAPLTDHYVSVSHEMAEKAVKARIGKPSRHSVIRSGFRTDLFADELLPKEEARLRLGLPPGRTVVGAVARLFPLKGHADIVEAAAQVVARHPGVLFVLVGDGTLRADLERTIADKGLTGHFQFLGLVDPEAMPAAYSSFDVLVHASRREGLARVFPQAVIAGVPVVAYDLDGSAEVIHDGHNGFLVPPCDTDALAERLSRLVGDPDLRSRLGGAGRDRVQREFSAEEMVRRLAELYTNLLAASGR
ncbi:MAG: glycosyltransferase family 4 protein [Acidimicrobiales bacterium]